jgi:hypothetical protein
VPCDAQVAVVAIRRGQARAPLEPCLARLCRVLAPGALERVERELAPGRRFPVEPAVRERALRVAIDSREFARGDSGVTGKIGRERLGEPNVAVGDGEPQPPPAIRRREIAACDQRREERIAGIGRGRAGKPQRLRRGKRVQKAFRRSHIRFADGFVNVFPDEEGTVGDNIIFCGIIGCISVAGIHVQFPIR